MRTTKTDNGEWSSAKSNSDECRNNEGWSLAKTQMEWRTVPFFFFFFNRNLVQEQMITFIWPFYLTHDMVRNNLVSAHPLSLISVPFTLTKTYWIKLNNFLQRCSLFGHKEDKLFNFTFAQLLYCIANIFHTQTTMSSFTND